MDARNAFLALVLFATGCQQPPSKEARNNGDEVRRTEESSNGGAEVRWVARKLIDALEPVCPLTEDPDLLKKYAPLRERYASIVKSAGRHSHARDLAIAEQDVAFDRTTFVVECVAPDQPYGFHKTMASYLDEHLNEVSGDLDRLDGLIGHRN